MNKSDTIFGLLEDLLIFPPLTNKELFDLFEHPTTATQVFNKSKAKMPYNLYLHKDTTGIPKTYEIVFPLSGFSKEDISIEVEKNTLYVTFKHNKDLDDNVEVLHKGLSTAETRVNFKLDSTINSSYISTRINRDRGLLSIYIEVPKEIKPSKIEIN